MSFPIGLMNQNMMSAMGGMGFSGMSMGMNSMMPGMSMGMGIFGGDMSSLSPDAMMGGGSSFFHPLMGGAGGGMMAGMSMGMGMVPGMGQNCCGQGGVQNQMMMKMMMMMMMMMMKMMQQQMGQCGQQGRRPCGPGAPGGCGGGQPVGMCGGARPSGGMQGMGGGQPIELKKGESYTTPGGSTISWKGHTVSVKEPGGNSRQLGGAAGGAAAGAMGGFMFAGMMSNGRGGGMMMAGMMVGGAVGACAGAQGGGSAKPNNWKVWGDPHINDGSGKQQDFKTNNAMFSLQDGTRVAMCAAGPKGVVERVRIFPPNTPVNGNTLGGIDPKKTTVYQNKGREKVASGTLDQYANYPGMNMSPFGNMMFGGMF